MNDQLIVTKLRPMSECKEGWLVLNKDYSFDICTKISGASGQIITSDTCNHYVLRENFIGCIPSPIYKPE